MPLRDFFLQRLIGSTVKEQQRLVQTGISRVKTQKEFCTVHQERFLQKTNKSSEERNWKKGFKKKKNYKIVYKLRW